MGTIFEHYIQFSLIPTWCKIQLLSLPVLPPNKVIIEYSNPIIFSDIAVFQDPSNDFGVYVILNKYVIVTDTTNGQSYKNKNL